MIVELLAINDILYEYNDIKERICEKLIITFMSDQVTKVAFLSKLKLKKGML
jgi:hypothetical protein